MKRPGVTLENYQAVYDYYEQHEQNQLFARFGHAAMAAVYRPHIAYQPGARQQIGHLLETGTRLIVATNHLTEHDQYVVAAMAKHEEVLRPLRGNTFIPSKEPLFKNPLMRRAIDGMGAVPTFRVRDVADKHNGQVISDETFELQRAASQRLLDASIAKINHGHNMAIFPEGTRNNTAPQKVQPLKTGVGIIATGVAPDVGLAILPAGFYYGEGDAFDSRHPSLCIGRPIVERFSEPEAVLEALQTAIQTCVDHAVDLHSA